MSPTQCHLLTLTPVRVTLCTGFSSEIRTKLRDWAVGQVGAGCYSWAALSSNDSKTRYYIDSTTDDNSETLKLFIVYDKTL